MLKKTLYLIIALAALMTALYFLQPLKKGTGLDAATRYEWVKDWPQLPAGLKLGNPTGIGTDTHQNIVLLHRAGREWSLFGNMPAAPINSKTVLIINNSSGRVDDSWGEKLFIMPHGLTVDNENNIWITDVGLHQVFKFSHNGKLLMKLGEARVAGNDSLHFNKPTDIAIASDGSFYVSDGYGNSRIIKFSPTGKYLFEWGRGGNKAGEFNIPHGICLDNTGKVYVADRENNRIQQFDANGRFLNQFSDNSFGAMCAVAFGKTNAKLFAVDDFTFFKVKHRGSDVFVFDTTGKVQTRFGRSGAYQGNAGWYHDVAIDDNGNIYVGDILNNTIQKFKKTK
ncbi:peptidyl-alpha-hydroxyglycine alpha-amidating lyase family protein [Foetidibacter luteolus]|uniref:peptidyl-alpha-hydroxyglycine alpha-amidating lyase family protein n=1 Tax=Foetidibacter luteolus TaxID=2608880 RepID=UPI00129B2D63|nr:peptidyl-alpha-hydroxyglycine alpha-amidating lyase family protein [Foetidibacter luteolus]